MISETSGHFQRLLVSMTQGARQETDTVDMAKAKADAQVQETFRHRFSPVVNTAGLEIYTGPKPV